MASNGKKIPQSFDSKTDPSRLDEQQYQYAEKVSQDSFQVTKDYDYVWTVTKSVLGTANHLMIGAITFVSCWFPVRNIHTGVSISISQIHILLCSIGYQLLMAEAILAFAPHSGWALPLKPLHRRHAHWIMQVAGSLFAISGSIVKIWEMIGNNFSTTHAIIGLVAMLLNGVALFNGIAAFYSTKFRNLIKPKYAKVLHIFIGASAYVLGVVCHCYGYDKNSFREWAGDDVTTAIIALNGFNTVLVISNPLMSIAKKASL